VQAFVQRFQKGLLALFAKRYIAGTERSDALRTARSLNDIGISATIDHLGENVKSQDEAESAVKEYINLLEDIKNSRIDAAVSLKLTHMGIGLSEQLAEKNAGVITKRALDLDNSVCFDMEGSAYTQKIIDIFLRLHKAYPNCGIAIQSCLYRSAEDVRLLINEKASVRLVKGAYKEPPDIAFANKIDVDKNFGIVMNELLLKGHKPAIATHDERLINEALKFAGENSIPKDSFELQMLLGIKRTMQKMLAERGYKVRVYVPYGTEWLPYALRRLRERKENILFVVRDIFDPRPSLSRQPFLRLLPSPSRHEP